MKTKGTLLSRIGLSVSELLHYRGSLARIRFQDNDSHISETSDQSLLRRRLRASALLLFVAKLAFSVRTFVLTGAPTPLDGVLLTGLLAVSIWLYSPRNTSIFWLRIVETTMFLGLSLQLGIRLHLDLRHFASLPTETVTESTRAAVSFVTAVKDQIIATFALMMIYGMFIPNTARRAAIMVLAMAVIPGIIIVLNESSRDALQIFRMQQFGAAGLFSGNLLSLAVGAGSAIYGTAIMNRWRSRALEAEQLGQYRLRGKIGSGGMGDVYLAEHRLMKRTCAVKLIRADLSEDPVILKRFEREVQATATLTHWNTVQVFDYGQMTDGTFFYVMEHLHGRNLKQAVDQTGPMPEDRVVFILRQICSALREAAARKLVHRDIKPSNVFLAQIGERFDVVKLLDFGLVRPLSELRDPELSGVNELKGSPRYMCPEQAQGISPDTRGDLYSLGAVAFFLLAGRPPFDLEKTLQLVIAHASQAPPTFADVGASVSPDLEAIVLRCLAKQPEDRFQTPDEMLTALRSLSFARSWNWQRAEDWWKERLPNFVHQSDICEISAGDVDAGPFDETLVVR
jgi:eukaryotic-like serine/threonine-protein kinase